MNTMTMETGRLLISGDAPPDNWARRHTFEMKALRETVRSVLTHSDSFGWSVQGFGMMRTYLDADKVYRLNIWHTKLSVPNVSTVHDHPWHFQSVIINGRFVNRRFVEDFYNGDPYRYMVIKTGEGGGPDGDRGAINLRPQEAEVYFTGDMYSQDSKEIHMSGYGDGTVTLNERRRVADGEHARVFWPYGAEWVDAKPRAATPEEVTVVCRAALKRWEN